MSFEHVEENLFKNLFLQCKTYTLIAIPSITRHVHTRFHHFAFRNGLKVLNVSLMWTGQFPYVNRLQWDQCWQPSGAYTGDSLYFRILKENWAFLKTSWSASFTTHLPKGEFLIFSTNNYATFMNLSHIMNYTTLHQNIRTRNEIIPLIL